MKKKLNFYYKEFYELFFLFIKTISLSSEINSNNSQQEENNDAPNEELVKVYSTLWFVGIELKPNNEVIDLNLTDTILGFKEIGE